MKKQLCALALLLAVFCVNAQSQTVVAKHPLDQNSIVQDSSGYRYPYVIWQKLTTSGDYIIRTINPKDENPSYLLVKLSEKEKELRSSRMPKPRESTFFTTGQVLKPFRVKDILGNKVETKDWAGKTVVLNFWFIGCPPCRAEILHLDALAVKYKDDPNVIFIGIALDQDDEVREFIKKSPFGYHLTGDGRYLANKFNINLYPTNVVIDKEGKVKFHSSGYGLNTAYWIEKTIQESVGTQL